MNKLDKTNVGADASVCPSTKTNQKIVGVGLDQPGSVKTDPYKIHAITLVALVITIIILIILAGVSLNLALGENGIFQKSKQAVDKYKDEAQKEQNEMDNLYNTLAGLTGDDDKVLNPPNAPVIPENLPTNTTMQLVKYQAGADGAEGTWVSDTEGTSWSYVAGTGNEDNTSSKWANAKVTIDNVDSYFVWIPRYAYKITPKQSGQAAGTIDVVFLQGTTDTYIDENGEEKEAKRATDDDIGNEVYLEDYIVHPSFTKTVKDGVKTYDNGEWSEELPGLWIGKYETSHTGCTQNASTGLGNSDENPITIKPGITSWRNDTIGKFYTAAINYSKDLNSHMLKNSEWGAVAYLTHSQYGRNGHEISINNNEDYITGIGSGSSNESETDDIANAYNTTTGMTASSTGNEYGIYDLSGGASEHVAAYYNGNGNSSLTNGSSFAIQNKTSDEYSTAYTGISASTNYKKGDATYETGGWNSDATGFVSSLNYFFNRGGHFGTDSLAGVFYCAMGGGNAWGNDSFRVCLAVM